MRPYILCIKLKQPTAHRPAAIVGSTPFVKNVSLLFYVPALCVFGSSSLIDIFCSVSSRSFCSRVKRLMAFSRRSASDLPATSSR